MDGTTEINGEIKEESVEEEKKEATVAETAVPAPAPKETAPKEGQQPAGKTERPKNCVRCNKPLKRKSWYYRNGKFFCSKGCWKLFQKKAA